MLFRSLETHDGVANARRKLSAKNADLIVLNSPEHGIGTETNLVTLVEARSTVELPEAGKREVAERILDRVLERRGTVAPELALAPRRASTQSKRVSPRVVGTKRRAVTTKPAARVVAKRGRR